MSKPEYLQDENFLLEMDNLRLRHQYARITVLDFQTEKKIEDITGRVSSGSISVSADSAVRRTGNLTFIIDDPEYQNLFKVSNLLSINKKIMLEVGLENTTDKYVDIPIIWYPQGIYVITQPSISYSTSGLTVSLQLKDKMCLLNGDCGGVFPAQTTLSEIENTDASGATVITYPTIYQIIQELVNHFGGEQLGKIIINDLGERTYQIMKSGAANPIYAYKSTSDPSADSYIITSNIPEEGIEYLQFNNGESICYSPTEFTYPGELIVSAGSAITGALDTIKNTLGGNFEYFYDLEGNFVFQEIKNYINTSQATILNNMKNKDTTGAAMNEAYGVARAKGKSVYDFKESPLIISYSTAPNYLNIKNDFLIWGARKSGSGKKYPIRYHLAIDKRPSLYNEDGSPLIFNNVYVYLSNTDTDANLLKAQIVIYLPISNIYDNGVGVTGQVYWIKVPESAAKEQIDAIKATYKTKLEALATKKSEDLNNAKTEAEKEAIESKYQTDKTALEEERDLAIKPYLEAGTNRFYVWSSDKVDYVDITSAGSLITNYKPTDWRTVLYLQGSLSDPYGTDSNYYYVELKNEWPKLYDLRPRKANGQAYVKGDTLYQGKPGYGQEFWLSVREDPTSMDYYLDFIDSDAAISEFNVDNIGRRPKVISDDDINCIFEPTKFCNTVAIRELKTGYTQSEKDKRDQEIQQCKLDGRGYSTVEPGVYDTLNMSNSYFSAYESIRSALQEYTDYNESLQISCIPIFHLEPNTRISIQNRALNINGDYLIKSISVPLGSGTMSINANKVIEKL